MLGTKKSEEWMVLCIFPSFPGGTLGLMTSVPVAGCGLIWWERLRRLPQQWSKDGKVSVGSESKNIFWSPASYISLTGSQNIDILDSDRSFLLCVSNLKPFHSFPSRCLIFNPHVNFTESSFCPTSCKCLQLLIKQSVQVPILTVDPGHLWTKI